MIISSWGCIDLLFCVISYMIAVLIMVLKWEKVHLGMVYRKTNFEMFKTFLMLNQKPNARETKPRLGSRATRGSFIFSVSEKLKSPQYRNFLLRPYLGSCIMAIHFSFKDLKPSNIAVNEDCELKVCYLSVTTVWEYKFNLCNNALSKENYIFLIIP